MGKVTQSKASTTSNEPKKSVIDAITNITRPADPTPYMDKYGAVDYTAWDKAIADIPDFEKRTRQVAYQKETRGGSVTKYRTEEYNYSNASRKNALTRAKNEWAKENKYKQQTLNQQIMAGAAHNENIANTSVNELDTAQSDNVDPAVTSVGKKKKTQGSLSTSLGL